MESLFETISILVVDDEAHIRRLAEKELSSQHRCIATAGSAQEALQAFRAGAFDVVLLDMRLPD